MASWKRSSAGLLAVALAACGDGGGGGNPNQEFIEAAPDSAGLLLELQGGGAEAALSAAAGVDASALNTLNPGLPDELEHSRERLRQLNTAVRAVMDRVGELTAAQATALPGEVREFGPRDLPAAQPAATFRLRMKKLGPVRFGFRVDAKPLGAGDEAFVPVAVGTIVRGAALHRGSGSLGIDADALRAVNAAAFPATGKLLAAFAHTGAAGKALAYRLVAFDADGPGTLSTPVTAVFVGHRNGVTGVTRVRLATPRDLVGPPANPSFNDELALSHLGWNPAAGKARAYALVTNYVVSAGPNAGIHGDVEQLGGQNAFWFGRACWQDGAKIYQDWTHCPWGQTLAQCAVDVAAQILDGQGPRHTRQLGLPGSTMTWEVACVGVADPAPATSGAGPVEPVAEEGAEATPDDPPATMPVDPTA